MLDVSSALEFNKFQSYLKEKATAEGTDPFDYTEKFIEAEIKKGKLSLEQIDLKGLFEGTVNFNRDVDLKKTDKVHKQISESLYPAITQPMIREYIDRQYDQEVGDLTKLFRQSNAMHTEQEKMIGMNDYGDLQRRAYGKAYEKSKPSDYSFESSYKDYGIIIELTVEDIANDPNMALIDKVSQGGTKQGKKLAEVLTQTIEMNSARNAFDEATNYAFFYKGVARSGIGAGGAGSTVFWATTSHSHIDGQANVNALSDAWSSDAVKAANQKLSILTTPVGDKMKVTPRFIICHSVLEQEVNEFLGSTMKYDTMEPVTNVWKGKLQVVSSPYFESQSRFFIGDPIKQMHLRWVEKPTTVARSGMTDANFEARVVQAYRHNLWFGAFHTDYRFLVSMGYAG